MCLCCLCETRFICCYFGACPLGLEAWFLLRVQEVPGSIPGADHLLILFCWNPLPLQLFDKTGDGWCPPHPISDMEVLTGPSDNTRKDNKGCSTPHPKVTMYKKGVNACMPHTKGTQRGAGLWCYLYIHLVCIHLEWMYQYHYNQPQMCQTQSSIHPAPSWTHQQVATYRYSLIQ